MGLLCCDMVPARAYIIAFVLIFCSCGRQDHARPAGLPSGDDEKFVDFWSRLRIIQEEGSLAHLDSLALKKKTDSLYTAYSYTPEGVSTTLDSYRADLPRWKEFHEHVAHRLEELQKDSL
jgi:hypothetical protein